MTAIPERTLEGSRVFVFEDDPIVAIDLEQILYSAGAKGVDLCFDFSEQAVEALRKADVAVLDVNFGDNSSGLIAQTLRERGTPFLVVSGFLATDLDPALHGAPLITKPFRSDELLACLNRFGGVPTTVSEPTVQPRATPHSTHCPQEFRPNGRGRDLDDFSQYPPHSP